MDYYQILGVKYAASQSEIKRAYRRLAVTYHPDKNPDPAAENIFKEINAAYDVLGDPIKKSKYDLRFETLYVEPSNETQPPRHRDPAYRRNSPRAKGKSNSERLKDLMAEYMPWAISITWFCFGFSALIMVDYILPVQAKQEKINSTSVRRTHYRTSISYWVIKTNGERTIEVPYEFSNHFLRGKEVLVSSTRLFNVARKVESGGFAVRLKKSIYGNFIFAPIALLIFSTLALFFRKNVEYGFNLSVTSILFLIFIGALLLIL